MKATKKLLAAIERGEASARKNGWVSYNDARKALSDTQSEYMARLPMYDPKKKDLPRRRDYLGPMAWLRAVRDCLGESFVFALDEALMCQGNFWGRTDEFLVWGYGENSATKFNGVILLGNRISQSDVQERNGLKFTSFNRTLTDALMNESILDMQGITEALSHYYYTHGESFDGIFVVPHYVERFEELAKDAVEYYGTSDSQNRDAVFYSKDNILELERRVEDIRSGKSLLKEHELIEADN